MSDLRLTKEEVGGDPLTSGLYSLRSSQAGRKLFAGVAKHNEPLTMQEVHEQLGHITPDSICQMIKDGMITGITLNEAHESMAHQENGEEKIIHYNCWWKFFVDC